MVMSSRKKRVAIIISWLLFLVVLSICFFALERNIYSRTAKTELADQAAAVRKQILPLVENDFFTEVAAIRVEAAKLKSLAFALSDYDDIKQAEPLLDDFFHSAAFSGLTIYDREGHILYSNGNDENAQLLSESPEAICEILDEKIYKLIEEDLTFDNEDTGYLLSSMTTPKLAASYFWGVGDRWLISMIDKISEAETYVIDHFSKDRVIRSISIGNTGYLVTIDQNNEKVINCPSDLITGKHMKNLEIRAGKEISSVADLNALFSDSDDVVLLDVAGEECYAYKLDFKSALMLVLLPASEIREKVNTSTITLIILIVFVTGLVVLYAFFHSDDANDAVEGEAVEQESTSRRSSLWSRTMSGKMRIIAILSIIGVFAGIVYLESLSLYAETFSYTESKVNKVVRLLDQNEVAMDMLQQWCDEESLTRSRIAKCIISHTDASKVDWIFLSELADSLGVEYIYRFDRDGNIVATNSPFDRMKISADSGLYPLLEGKAELVLPPADDPLSGRFLQNAGISIFDENNRSEGFVLVSLNPEELSKVRSNLGFNYIFEQLALSDGSYAFAVDEEDMKISFVAYVEDNKLETDIESYEYVGMNVTELGIDEKVIRDNFNGNVFLFENTYFASIQRVEDTYYIVMRPQVKLGVVNIIPAAFATGMSLLFMIALTVLSSIGSDDKQKQEPVVKEKARRKSKARRDKDILSMLGHMFEKKKPYFEDRWPNDSKKWKARTAAEKFTSASEYLVLAALLFIYLHAKLAGSRSIWYYCVAGKWETGINLYSVTTCILSICMLLIVKIIVHKLLYLVAMAVGSKGETICHLTDNFSGYALVIAGIFICLHHFGVNATALSLTGGIAGVIFGLGCQNMVADILSGLIMAFSGEVRVGDFVSYNGNYGTILSIGVRTTKLKWFGEVTLIRNNDFKNVVLFGSTESRRVLSYISIDLKESLERVEKIIEKELPVMHDNLSKKGSSPINGPIYRGVDAITQDGTTLSFFLFCQSPDFMLFIREMNRELKLMCERNNINLAMHQVVVNEPEPYPQKKQ